MPSEALSKTIVDPSANVRMALLLPGAKSFTLGPTGVVLATSCFDNLLDNKKNAPIERNRTTDAAALSHPRRLFLDLTGVSCITVTAILLRIFSPNINSVRSSVVVIWDFVSLNE